MPEAKIKEILLKLRQGLERLYGERLVGVYLFGSFARAEATPESDVDVLIVLDEVMDYGREIERTGHLVSGLSLDHPASSIPSSIAGFSMPSLSACRRTMMRRLW